MIISIIGDGMAGEQDLSSAGRPVRIVVHRCRIIRNVFRSHGVFQEVFNVHDENITVGGGGTRVVVDWLPLARR
jgi:hypothetical protein